MDSAARQDLHRTHSSVQRTATARNDLGRLGEEATAQWYDQRGYRIIVRNWRCAFGELDLVLESEDSSVVVFCEVKTRRSVRFGTGFDAVDGAKQRRIRRLAGTWLTQRRTASGSSTTRPPVRDVRFDVAAVTRDRHGNLAIEVMEGAF